MATVVDPVCGMTVDSEQAAGSTVFEGKSYFFCHPSCLRKFEADPQHFLTRQRAEGASPLLTTAGSRPPLAGTHADYICPMHPELHSDRPGACPKCGMALEPRVASAEEHADPELRAMTRRFWISLVLGLPIFVLSMGEMQIGRASCRERV